MLRAVDSQVTSISCRAVTLESSSTGSLLVVALFSTVFGPKMIHLKEADLCTWREVTFTHTKKRDERCVLLCSGWLLVNYLP